MLRESILALVVCAAAPLAARSDGTPTPHVEARMPVAVSTAERDFVLGEMRGLLVAVRELLAAAAANDPERMARAARAAGMERHRQPPAGLPEKLPAAFRQLGFGLHAEFDVIARELEALRDRDAALKRIAENMGRCVACHAAYRFAVDDGGAGAQALSSSGSAGSSAGRSP